MCHNVPMTVMVCFLLRLNINSTEIIFVYLIYINNLTLNGNPATKSNCEDLFHIGFMMDGYAWAIQM